MALLTLKDIGKIYVSEGNVAVGIRGVTLSFDKGEFVAVTGKSGSGKSTLLNVISGMDSYEEGEMYVEGQPTSHYLQPEWEEYRQKYISFIFQDYNIIESFTVLQNVELALMHIEDKRERRRRAMELIRRVGLEAHVRHKGSKLSGGQKQRTVIARALAKDSPIILADEPTGNLDSATSAEIIELLREVSEDKLLIVVTHNFEQVESCATRHIRVFDGAIESDRVLRPTVADTEVDGAPPATAPDTALKDNADGVKRRLKNGITLGTTVFNAKPRLSAFLSFLMIIGTLGIFFVTTLCGDARLIWEKHYMFTPIDGRVVLASQNGAVIGEDEVKRLAEEYGAESYLTCDALLDSNLYRNSARVVKPDGDVEHIKFRYTYGKSYGDKLIGRYPQAENEVLLRLPISYKPIFGSDAVSTDSIMMNSMTLKVVGVSYYYDNNIEPECLFTDDGFRTATAVYYLMNNSNVNITGSIKGAGDRDYDAVKINMLQPSFELEEGKLYIADYASASQRYQGETLSVKLNFTSSYYNYDYYSYNSEQNITFSRRLTENDLTLETAADVYGYTDSTTAVVSTALLRDIAESVLADSYRQTSLFFENDKAAHNAAAALREEGYVAVPSDTTYTPDAYETLSSMMTGVLMVAVWLLSIVFLAFFINLCSSRTLSAFKSDMAVMRSMGIPAKVIRIGMYVRMLMALIPAFVLAVVTAVLIYTVPQFNSIFAFLYPWQYVLIFFGMIAMTLRITHKQIRRLFGESVKKALRGGATE